MDRDDPMPPAVMPQGVLGFDMAFALGFEERLAAYLSARRWFRGKSRTVARAKIGSVVRVPYGKEAILFNIVDVTYSEGPSEEYVLPLVCLPREEADPPSHPQWELAKCRRDDGSEGVLVDALRYEPALRALLSLVANQTVLTEAGLADKKERNGEDGAAPAILRGRTLGRALEAPFASPHPLDAEQSNTSVAYGREYILKVLRRLDNEPSADLEMSEFLTQAGFAHTARVRGVIERVRAGKTSTVALLHEYVANEGDSWQWALDELCRFFDKTTLASIAPLTSPKGASWVVRASRPSPATSLLGDTLGRVRLLAERVAQMHQALASCKDVPAFAPEPLEREERATLAEAAHASLLRTFKALHARRPSLPAVIQPQVDAILHKEPILERRLLRFGTFETHALKMRVHGDLHLGQVLFTGKDFVIIDFEGEPARSIAERKAKRSPLVDVAGMLRSLHYASVTGARLAAERSSTASAKAGGSDERATQAPMDSTGAHAATTWYRWTSAAFLGAYLEAAKGQAFLTEHGETLETMIDFYLLEKCIYEVNYEIDNRPDWVAIPLAGLAELAEADGAP